MGGRHISEEGAGKKRAITPYPIWVLQAFLALDRTPSETPLPALPAARRWVFTLDLNGHLNPFTKARDVSFRCVLLHSG